MKKIISLLVMLFVLVITGCSCSIAGEYEFESMIIVKADKQQSYSCEDEEKIVDGSIAGICEAYEEMEINLIKNSKIMVTLDDVEILNGLYKIEGDKLYVKLNENEDYYEYAKLEQGKIIIENEGMKIIFEK